MILISSFLDRILFGKNEIFAKIYLLLLFGFGFSTYYLNRPALSKIAVVLLLLIFTFSFLRLVAKRDFRIDTCFVFSFVVLLFVLISNFVSGVFSYDFIVLIGIFYCSYLFVKLDISKYLFLSLIALTIGASLGCCLVFIHYLRVGFSHYLDSFFGNADGIADGAASFSILSFLLSVLAYRKYGIKKVFFLSLVSIPFLLMVIIFRRVGPIIKIFVFLLIVLELYLWKKNKFLFVVSIALVFTFLIIMFTIPFKQAILSRIQQSFIQMKYLDYYIEGSVRERTLMLFRDFDYFLRFPIIGNGMYNYLNYNSVPSHNLFGSIGGDYGLVVSLLLFGLSLLFTYKTRNNKQFRLIALYFLLVVVFSVFYGTCFLSRMTYFVAGSLFAASDQTSFNKFIEKYTSNINEVYK